VSEWRRCDITVDYTGYTSMASDVTTTWGAWPVTSLLLRSEDSGGTPPHSSVVVTLNGSCCMQSVFNKSMWSDTETNRVRTIFQTIWNTLEISNRMVGLSEECSPHPKSWWYHWAWLINSSARITGRGGAQVQGINSHPTTLPIVIPGTITPLLVLLP